MLIRPGRMGRIGGATRTLSVTIPAFGLTGAATIPMQNWAGSASTGAASFDDVAVTFDSTIRTFDEVPT